MRHDLLKSILNDEFLGDLAKSADLYKIGSNSVLDPEEIRIGLKVVPRAVMSMLISELTPLAINSHKDIRLPFGVNAYMAANKNAADDYTGSVYNNNKLVYDFKNRSIPGLGIILLSTFELYDLEALNKPTKMVEDSDVEKKIQRAIDERMELHSLVSKVVEDKISQREAIHKLMMMKLSEAMQPKPEVKVFEPIKPAKPLEIKESDIVKKENIKKELPLKAFLDRKKKPKEYSVKIEKSEVINCGDCGQTIFGNSTFSGCICYGIDQNKKIWVKKTEDGIKVKFSRHWDADNIEILLEALRKKNE